MLLSQRRFLPLFVVQFLTAFNDTLFKNAVVMLIVFKAAMAEGNAAAELSALVWGLYMLPFVVLSALAGQLSERTEKALLVRGIKFVDLALAVLAAAGFIADELWILLLALALKGVTSTFFGPVKYAILPEHLAPDELITGNALVEGGTFLAIPLGTITGAILILQSGGQRLVSAVFLSVAVAALVAAWLIPRKVTVQPTVKVQLSWTIATETVAVLRTAATDRVILWAILGISWFWMFGTIFISQLPALTNDFMTGSGEVVPLLMACFAVGTGLGLVLFARLLKGNISTRYVPLAGLLMSLGSADVWFSCQSIEPATSPLSPLAFLSDPSRLRIVADLFLVAVAGGGFTVPLSALLQQRSVAHNRSRIIAASNAVNSLLTVVAIVATIVVLSAGLPLPQLFAGMAVLNMCAALLLRNRLPQQ